MNGLCKLSVSQEWVEELEEVYQQLGVHSPPLKCTILYDYTIITSDHLLSENSLSNTRLKHEIKGFRLNLESFLWKIKEN